jgi:RNA polymerase sigma-70 factor, Bacteroides expansion family 1
LSPDPLHNEKEVLSHISTGDETAFARLYDHYKDRVYGTALKITHSTIIAEEVVGDVFLKIWLQRSSLKEIQNFSAYLFIVTRNHVYKILKQIARNYKIMELTDEDVSLNSEYDTSDLLMEKEFNLLLRRAIEQLPNQQKKVYSLIRNEGLKRDEVAHQLHLQPETVKFHLAQAMKNIRAFCMLHLGSFLGFFAYLFPLFGRD